ncbi:MAG: DUF488 domain-containing protein [Solidesulfovibrio sp. DCME]|uniref:DUF488 domain-containing protein n=1 Tax=Solidesulfovibrio sp. DCME TaxID=3447380 RepID=UPI003D0AA2D2
MFMVKRVYAAASPQDGKRYLVDRIWPRGLTKERAGLDGWLKDLAPSHALRAFVHGDPAGWEQFEPRYRQELTTPAAASLLETLREEAESGVVTLLYAAKDEQRNNAVCLKKILEDKGRG